MYVAGNLIRMLSKGLEFIGGLCQRFASLLSNLLPAVLSPAELTSLIKHHYDKSYAHTAQHFTTDVYEWTLEAWEQEAMHRHGISSGHILVLGSGVGREAIALAQRGLNVIGLDINGIALQVARGTARTLQVPAQFVRAVFFTCLSHLRISTTRSCPASCIVPFLGERSGKPGSSISRNISFRKE